MYFKSTTAQYEESKHKAKYREAREEVTDWIFDQSNRGFDSTPSEAFHLAFDLFEYYLTR